MSEHSALLPEKEGYRLIVTEASWPTTHSLRGSRLLETTSTDGIRFSSPTPLSFGLPRSMELSSPHAIDVEGRQYLYFTGADHVDAPARLFRCELRDGRWGEPQVLSSLRAAISPMSTPVFEQLKGHGVAVVFRDAKTGELNLATSADGLRFSSPTKLSDVGKASRPALGSFSDGKLSLSYQAGARPDRMRSYVRTSLDGRTWSAPVRVSALSENVHDTVHLRRADGGVDLYYISQSSPRGFSLFRRALLSDGTLGGEERLSGDDVGNAQKPQPARLSDGRIHLRFVVQPPTGPHRLAAVTLEGDARQ